MKDRIIEILLVIGVITLTVSSSINIAQLTLNFDFRKDLIKQLKIMNEYKKQELKQNECLLLQEAE